MHPMTILVCDLDDGDACTPHSTVRVEVPRHLVGLVEQVVEAARGATRLFVLSGEGELDVNAAAELLGVSRSHLVKLLERGRIDHRRVGDGHRIVAGALVDHMQEQQGLHDRVAQLSAASQDRAEAAVLDAAGVSDEMAHKLGL